MLKSMIEYIGKDPNLNRSMYILHLEDLDLVPDSSKLKYFVVLLVEKIDNIDNKKVNSFITKLLDYGMVWLCTWGKNCELIHDITDEIYSNLDNSIKYIKDEHSDDTIMTTWHNDEKLENVLWFSLNLTIPTDGFIENTKNIIIIVINNKNHYDKILYYLNNLDSLNKIASD
jgi:hypothetical protein